MILKYYCFLILSLGNEKLLRCDRDPRNGLWNKLLNFYADNHCLVDTDRFPVRKTEFGFRKHAMATYVPVDGGPTVPNPDRATIAPRFERKLRPEMSHQRQEGGRHLQELD